MKALVSLAFLFLFSSAFAQNAKEDQKYFPCKPGTKWVYNNDSTRVAIIEVKKVTGNEIFIQTKYFLKEGAGQKTDIFTFSNHMLLKTRSSEGLENPEQLESLTPAQIMLKFPVEEGDCWSLISQKGRVERKIKKKHSEISINGKTYKDVIEIDEKYENVQNKYFYCKNIGLIQLLVNDSEKGTYVTYMTLAEIK
jgi:hypothetical protein